MHLVRSYWIFSELCISVGLSDSFLSFGRLQREAWESFKEPLHVCLFFMRLRCTATGTDW